MGFATDLVLEKDGVFNVYLRPCGSAKCCFLLHTYNGLWGLLFRLWAFTVCSNVYLHLFSVWEVWCVGPLPWPRVCIEWSGYGRETVSGDTSVCASVPMRHDTPLMGSCMLKNNQQSELYVGVLFNVCFSSFKLFVGDNMHQFQLNGHFSCYCTPKNTSSMQC